MKAAALLQDLFLFIDLTILVKLDYFSTLWLQNLHYDFFGFDFKEGLLQTSVTAFNANPPSPPKYNIEACRHFFR